MNRTTQLLALLTVAALWLPPAAYAQDEDGSDDAQIEASPDGDEGDGHDGEPQADEGGGQYEPDQRGVTEGEDLYEPDQRGVMQPSPAPEPEPTVPTDRERQLEDESEGSGDAGAAPASESAYGGGAPDRDGLGFDLQLWLGGGATGLDALSGDNLLLPSQAGGGAVSFGVYGGVRIGPVSVGPRLSLAVHNAFALGTTGLDVQVTLTEDRVSPYLRLNLGYAFVVGLSSLPSQDASTVHGLNAELGFGLAGRLGGPFTFGAELAGTYLHLDRLEVDACEDPCTSGPLDLGSSGEGDGIGFRVHVFTGVSF